MNKSPLLGLLVAGLIGFVPTTLHAKLHSKLFCPPIMARLFNFRRLSGTKTAAEMSSDEFVNAFYAIRGRVQYGLIDLEHTPFYMAGSHTFVLENADGLSLTIGLESSGDLRIMPGPSYARDYGWGSLVRDALLKKEILEHLIAAFPKSTAAQKALLRL